ncbi:MAG: hypothetical protein DRR19_10710 [Candidatus Parabeggiatoa sp. nov. 1]|nr:MAG: hypothetical protein DRR19_10710 [Gammaproteobacteria bacterium]
MGYTLPQAQCLGIDASARQIEQGQALLAELNLPNVRNFGCASQPARGNAPGT